MPDFRYKAFISYSWSDKVAGAALHRALETYRTPKGLRGQKGAHGPVPARLFPIFKDREETAAGAALGATIEAALDQSEFLIVLCSPRSAASQWVNREIAYFKARRDPSKILAYILEGEPAQSLKSQEVPQECFPKALLFRVDAALTILAEPDEPPLAADARTEGDGPRLARLKLIAALLGVGLDDLVRRDERRRARRWQAISAGAIALSSVMSALALTAVLSRNEAIRSRNEAIAAKAEAVFQRNEAQGLVEFMLTDLRSRLEAVGRLDVLDVVGERALTYFVKQDAGKLDAAALGQRARTQLLIGEIDNLRGDLAAASASYSAAAETTAEELRRAPEGGQQIFNHAQSFFYVGYIAWQRGRLGEARSAFAEYLALAERLIALDPNRDDWRAELGYAHSNLGTLALDEGRAAEAEGHFALSLAVETELAKTQSDNPDRLFTLGQANAWLANARERQLKFAAAIEARKFEIATYQRILSIDTANRKAESSANVARSHLADLHLALGDISTALHYAREAAASAAQLMSADPDNLLWAEWGSLTQAALGEVLLYQGDLRGARMAALKAIGIAERLKARDETVVQWRGRTLAQPRLVLARIELAQGRRPQARGLIDQTLLDLKALIDAGNTDITIMRRHIEALSIRARIDRAFAEWPEISKRLSGHKETGDAQLLLLLAESEAKLGHADSARELAERLSAAGYAHPNFSRLLAENRGLLAKAQ